MLKNATNELKEIVQSDEFQALKDIRGEGFFEDMLKFFDVKYVDRAEQIVKEQLLYKRHNMKIFDIGSGFGYFPWLCKRIGHDVICSDIHVDLYDRVREFLGLEGVRLRVVPLEKLQIEGKFDMISALKCSFHDMQGKKWGRKIWRHFYKECVHHLNKKGMLYITSSDIMDVGGKRCDESLYIK